MGGKVRKKTRLEMDSRELERLFRKYRDSDDPETCWAVYLIAQSLARQRKRLRTATGDT